MTKRKTILGLLTSFFLCLSAICFAACGETKFVSFITVGLPGVQNDNQTSLYVERNYGDTSNLGDFVITATYSDNSTKTLNTNDVSVDVSLDGETLNLSDYLTAVQNGNLNIGSWQLVFKYDDISFIVYVNVKTADDSSSYTLKLNTYTTQMGGKSLTEENSIFYGTKAENVFVEIYKDDLLQQSIAESNTYILMQNDAGILKYCDVSLGLPTELKSPAESYDENLLLEIDNSVWQELTPGKYLICSKIKIDANHNETFSSYQTITVEKAPFVVENATVDESNLDNYTGLKFDWNFVQSKGLYCDVNLTDMVSTRNVYLGEGFSGDMFGLVLCQNDAENYKEKIILTNVVDSRESETQNSIAKILNYGNFVAVPDAGQSEKLFNAFAGYKKVKVKFVPNNEYQNLYAESAPFDMLIKVNPGQVTIQQAELSGNSISFENNGQIKANNLKISMLNAPYTVTYSSNINYSYDESSCNHVFTSTTAGNFSATFGFKGNYNNYFWQIPADFTTSGYSYTTQKLNYNGVELITSVTYNWSVSKLNLANDYSLGFGLFDANGNNTFELTNETDAMTMYLKAGFEYNPSLNLTSQGIELNWVVQPLGTTEKSLVSTLTGRLESYDDKDGNVFKKFVYTDASVDNADSLTLAINISFAGNVNFEAYNHTFFIDVAKIQPCSKENLAKTFSIFEDENTGLETVYCVYQEGLDFGSFISNMAGSEYGAWSIMSVETGMTVESMDMITKGSYVLTFTANSNMPYVKSDTVDFYFLDAEPTSMDDFI